MDKEEYRMKKNGKMTAKELKKLFGIVRERKLTKEQKLKAREITSLFEALFERTGAREAKLFALVYEDAETASTKLLHFLHHVTECPPEVLAMAEKLIAEQHEKEMAKTAAST